MSLIIFYALLLSVFNSNPKSPKDFIWKNRLIIIQSGDRDSSWFQTNLKKDLEDRKLLIFEFNGSLLVNTNSEEQIEASKFLDKLQNKDQKSDQWVLIGLDGGLKNSGFDRPTPSEIFKIIDAMPMRQSEIKKSGI
jgi:hypothetical protein